MTLGYGPDETIIDYPVAPADPPERPKREAADAETVDSPGLAAPDRAGDHRSGSLDPPVDPSEPDAERA